MDIIEIQNKRCLCDPERLRILNLLRRGHLSIHDLSSILESTPRRLIEHLSMMEKRGMVVSGNNGVTVVYRLPENPTPLLINNLKCLREVQNESTVYYTDLEKLDLYLTTHSVPRAQ